jgi:hypothetical protein
MYTVFAKHINDEFIFIASCKELQDAIQIVKEFKLHFPREYVVRDSEGNDIDVRE